MTMGIIYGSGAATALGLYTGNLILIIAGIAVNVVAALFFIVAAADDARASEEEKRRKFKDEKRFALWFLAAVFIFVLVMESV